MTGRLAICLFLLCGLILGGAAFSPVSAVQQQEKPTYIYICGCAMAKGCQTFFKNPGNCPCGKPLFKKQVIREDAEYYYVTHDAEVDCTCQHTGTDHTECDCGKDLYALAKSSRIKSLQCIKNGHDIKPPAGN